MYIKKYVTFLNSHISKRMYLGVEREFIELSFLQHNRDNTLTALKVFTTTNKLKKVLDYRGISALTVNDKYILYLSDYKGNKKFTFSNIKKWEQ